MCNNIGLTTNIIYLLVNLLGLLQAVANTLPNNFKKHFLRYALKDKLWNCARATHPNKFKDGFETLKVLDPHADSWLEKSNHFSHGIEREVPRPLLKLKLHSQLKSAKKRKPDENVSSNKGRIIKMSKVSSGINVTNVEDELMDDIIASIDIPEGYSMSNVIQFNTNEEDENGLQAATRRLAPLTEQNGFFLSLDSCAIFFNFGLIPLWIHLVSLDNAF
ncbi:hypothetical protein M9H77_19254 [Catharanthus roseus]|uniref:Uncharacterized protein n=1 Tax=Catharanthus roseus TaxID=4058 RepID=A0ACC0B9T0_CATRO|nr:hypothetical protein M9H77_19254 [Catharanthus roseus]